MCEQLIRLNKEFLKLK